MILHCVFCKIDPATDAGTLDRVMHALMSLQDTVPGIRNASYGTNIDLEHKSQGFTHGFAMTFEHRDALEAYHDHPLHLAAGKQLVAICTGGADGIMVFDLDISD